MELAATRGSPVLPLSRAWLKGTDDFSFSGLKTALLHLAREKDIASHPDLVPDAAASFQQAVVDVLVAKTIEAAVRLEVSQIVVAGGVAANRALAGQLRRKSPVPVAIPPPELCTDNAAMVAACGYYHLAAGRRAGPDLDVVPNLSIG